MSYKNYKEQLEAWRERRKTIHAEYTQNGLSFNAIAAKYDISPTTAKRIVDRYTLELEKNETKISQE